MSATEFRRTASKGALGPIAILYNLSLLDANKKKAAKSRKY
jgi:hypothetical protein